MEHIIRARRSRLSWLAIRVLRRGHIRREPRLAKSRSQILSTHPSFPSPEPVEQFGDKVLELFLSESTDFRDRLQCVPPVDRNRRPVSMLSGRKKDLFLQVCSVGKNSALKAGHLMQLYNPAVCLPVLFARSW